MSNFSGSEEDRALWESINKEIPGGFAGINKPKQKRKRKKVNLKPSAFEKPKKDLLGMAIEDRNRRYRPYQRINKALK